MSKLVVTRASRIEEASRAFLQAARHRERCGESRSAVLDGQRHEYFDEAFRSALAEADEAYADAAHRYAIAAFHLDMALEAPRFGGEERTSTLVVADEGIEIMRLTPDGKVFANGVQVSDPVRLGAAFITAAKILSPSTATWAFTSAGHTAPPVISFSGHTDHDRFFVATADTPMCDALGCTQPVHESQGGYELCCPHGVDFGAGMPMAFKRPPTLETERKCK